MCSVPEGAFAGDGCSHGAEEAPIQGRALPGVFHDGVPVAEPPAAVTGQGGSSPGTHLSGRRCVVFRAELFPSLTQKNPEDIQ